MFSTGKTNFRELYFEHKPITNIHGEPIFADLYLLLHKLKENLPSVPCPLGGCAYGYLGIIITPLQYMIIVPGNPLVDPPSFHPGPYALVAGTQCKISTAKSTHETEVKDALDYGLILGAVIN